MLSKKFGSEARTWSRRCFFTLTGLATIFSSTAYAVNEETDAANASFDAEAIAMASTSGAPFDGQEDIDVAKVSEAFGHLIAGNLDNPGFQFDMEAIIKGMRDALDGRSSPMSEEQYERAIASIQEKIFHEMAQKNLHEADEFMAQNAKNNQVVVLENGKLQYCVTQVGTGREVPPDGTPLINYTGKYLDGTVFGSSFDNGAPITLPLDRSIAGFRQGLVGMKEGEKRTLYIHPEMGYGLSGHLPPNSLLVFEIELLEANRDIATADEQTPDACKEAVR